MFHTSFYISAFENMTFELISYFEGIWEPDFRIIYRRNLKTRDVFKQRKKKPYLLYDSMLPLILLRKFCSLANKFDRSCLKKRKEKKPIKSELG